MNFAKLSEEAVLATKTADIYAPENVEKEEYLPDNYDINKNQELKITYDYIKQNVPVIFLTGGAGTGKSTFIKFLKNNLKSDTGKNCIVLAPTGIAAVNVGGQTIHSFFKFKVDIFEDKDIKEYQKNPVVDHIDLIIIDEISMVHSWMLDHIDYALRLWTKNEKPFGEKQVLLIGDCFQLPPVVDTNNDAVKKFIENHRYESPFFFAAKVFRQIDVKPVQLKEIYRQKDRHFVNILNRIRKCEAGYENDIDFLNETAFIKKRLGTDDIPEECLKLTTKNCDAEESNKLKLKKLKKNDAKTKIFEGEVTGNFNFEHFLTPQTLELCIGAKVLVTKNLKAQNLANGTMGNVVGFGGDGKSSQDYVDIEIKGETYRIFRESWQSIRYQWNESTKTIHQITGASFNQIPLMLGWAVTIHKAQGLTLDAVAIDAEDSWDFGQVYVALSRAKSFNGVFLCKKIPCANVKANGYIQHIYKKLFNESVIDNSKCDYDELKKTLDNSKFTVSREEVVRSVNISGLEFELYPKDGERIQPHVRRTMERLLSNNLIPMAEMKLLLTDKDYCYQTFGINWHPENASYSFKYTLLKKVVGDSDSKRYYAKPINGYYLCSQWYQSLTDNFANWLIELSEGKLGTVGDIKVKNKKTEVKNQEVEDFLEYFKTIKDLENGFELMSNYMDSHNFSKKAMEYLKKMLHENNIENFGGSL